MRNLWKESQVTQPMKLRDCERCNGKCCTFIHLKLPEEYDTPDIIRWITLHKGIYVYTASNSQGTFKFLEIRAPCSKLKNGRCSIYEDRPDVCKHGGETDYLHRNLCQMGYEERKKYGIIYGEQ